MDDHRRQTQQINDATYAAWNAHDADADRWVLSGTHTAASMFGIPRSRVRSGSAARTTSRSVPASPNAR